MKKKFWSTLGVIVAVIILVAGLLVLTTPARVVGRWEFNTGYLDSYGCYGKNTYFFKEDRTYVHVLSDLEGETILKVTEGTWKASGLEIECRRVGQNGSTPFTYNPINNTLNNGGGLIAQYGDNILKKVS